MKKWVVVLVVSLAAVELFGCASVQKKFTRKKKEPAHTAAVIFTEEGPYQKKYSNDYYYKIHFVQWKSWHSELISDLGGNSKKVSRDGDEAINHLEEMCKYLSEAKKAELAPHISSLRWIVTKLESGHYANANSSGMRVDLEKIQRIISNNFYYDKIKADLLSDTVDLGGSPSPQPTPAV